MNTQRRRTDAGHRSLYDHGFVRVAAAVPRLRVTDVVANVADTIDLLHRAADDSVALAVFPELGLVGYTSGDLLHQQVLLDAAVAGLCTIRDASVGLPTVAVVGLPMRQGQQLYNVAAVVHGGRVLGVVPKSYLPNYREFYEKRHFSAARSVRRDEIDVDGTSVPFGADLLFNATDIADFVLSVEICEDLWVPVPPSTWSTLAGATVVANPSASNITIAKADYRRQLCAGQSARTIAAYVYSAAGAGESTTDLAWDGHGLIAENGNIVAEGERFAVDPHLVVADVDLDRLIADRVRTTSFGDCADDHADHRRFRTVSFELGDAGDPGPLRRDVPRFPFVPADPRQRDERCREVFSIQVNGLATRLAATRSDKVVIGVSGGLDSTHALLVAVRCMDQLGRPRSDVLGITMPGFATSARTLRNAHRLMGALGVTAEEVDIRPASQQMLADIGHPAASGEAIYDVAYENVQAGARTSLLFRVANHRGGIVLGTGDLSELALGWCTYGVGDQMSHYGVNSSVPKSLIRHLVRWAAGEPDLVGASEVLLDVLDTAVSPELVPHSELGDESENGDAGRADDVGQRSEDVVGPYELQDFHLYYVLRFGYRPSKVAFLASQAWGDTERGRWPDDIDVRDRRSYTDDEIDRWLRVFLTRFMATSQFKRSAMPDGPKVGSGGALSPRGDWRAPSDGTAALWIAELDG
ncbi:MAG: NAD(+) synthase [Microthrixaceae bacterium]|nr:NAD(+) synthase [Microthrixaceae bacterium]